jgi:hypothetical protein
MASPQRLGGRLRLSCDGWDSKSEQRRFHLPFLLLLLLFLNFKVAILLIQPLLLAKTPLSLSLRADEFDYLVLPGWWQLQPSEGEELQNEVQQHVDYYHHEWPHVGLGLQPAPLPTLRI